jgi:hypothetical protein
MHSSSPLCLLLLSVARTTPFQNTNPPFVGHEQRLACSNRHQRDYGSRETWLFAKRQRKGSSTTAPAPQKRGKGISPEARTGVPLKTKAYVFTEEGLMVPSEPGVADEELEMNIADYIKDDEGQAGPCVLFLSRPSRCALRATV